MERIKSLNRYQQGILLLLIVMALIFTVVYSVTSSRVGFLYKDKILVPSQVGKSTVYVGTIQGTECSFTVTPDKTVVFQYGARAYGPYTAVEDPTAIPKDDPFSEHMTGVEVRNKDEIIFRGGVFRLGGSDSISMLVNEDGSNASVGVTATLSDGTMVDIDGNVVDPMEPSVFTILELMGGPELVKKGEWIAWFTCVFLSIVIAVTILFADELFRWNLHFQIRNADRAEPSDWEIAGRYIGWTVIPIMILWLYILGLR